MCPAVLAGLLLTMMGMRLCKAEEESCPVWFESNDGMCVCRDSIPGHIYCSQQRYSTSLHLGSTLGYNDKNNKTVVSKIAYIFPHELVINSVMEIELGNKSFQEARSYLCHSIKRSQNCENCKNFSFCGRCIPGYGPAVYTFGMQCAKCKPWKSIYYFLLQILPITTLYVVVLVFQVNLTSPNMFNYIVFCNIVTIAFRHSQYITLNYFYSSQPLLRVLLKILLTISGIWSLDFFRFVVKPFCFNEKVRDLCVPLFDLFPALWIILLTSVLGLLVKLYSCKVRPIMWFCKPFRKMLVCCRSTCTSNPTKALTHAYATFFFLFFFKTLFVAITIIIKTPAYSSIKAKRRILAYDPTYKYFDKKHLFIVLIVYVAGLFIIVPALLLLVTFNSLLFKKFYQTSLKSWYPILKVFTKTFQNGYKDGSQGTRDFRSMTGWFLIMILIIIGFGLFIIELTLAKTDDEYLVWLTAGAFFTVSASLYGVLQPYKRYSENVIAVFLQGSVVLISGHALYVDLNSISIYKTQQKLCLWLILLAIAFVHVSFGIFQVVMFLKHYCRHFKSWCCHFKKKNAEEETLLQNPRAARALPKGAKPHQ